MRTSPTLTALILAVGFAAAGCGADADPSASTADVTIERSRFGPDPVTVAIDGTVTFTNTDPFDHTVTAKPGVEPAFGSGLLEQDETFDVTFGTAGTFAYFCEIHPTMRAMVVVS